MTIKSRPMSADGKKIDRRKKPRFQVAIPIEVSWRGVDGIVVKEDAMARLVNANGGFLKMESYPDLGTRITLANFLSAQTAEARVVAVPNTREGVANGIIAELISPDESFWGVDLQLKKASLELEQLEIAMKREEADPRLLDEYRDSAEYVRTTAAALQQLRQRQLRGQDESELLAILTIERIQRMVKMCSAVIGDFEAGRIKNDTKGFVELREMIKHLHEYLKQSAR